MKKFSIAQILCPFLIVAVTTYRIVGWDKKGSCMKICSLDCKEYHMKKKRKLAGHSSKDVSFMSTPLSPWTMKVGPD